MCIYTCIYIIIYYNIILLKIKLKQYKKISHEPLFQRAITTWLPKALSLMSWTEIIVFDTISGAAPWIVTHTSHTSIKQTLHLELSQPCPCFYRHFCKWGNKYKWIQPQWYFISKKFSTELELPWVWMFWTTLTLSPTQIFVSSYNATHPLDGSGTACVYQPSRVRQLNKQKTSDLSSRGCTVPCRQRQTHTQGTADKRTLEFLTELECKDIQQSQPKPVPGISPQLTELNTCSWQHPLIWNDTKEVTFEGWHIKSWSE